MGIDWAEARLVKAESDASGQLAIYVPRSEEHDNGPDRVDSFEVYLTVESEKTTVTLRLDDCLSIDGKDVIGDCFLAPNMEGW